MLRSEVIAPVAWELELLTLLHSLLENLDTLGVRQTNKLFLQHTLKTSDKSLVNHLVEELEVVLTVVKSPLYAELDEILFKIHELVHVDKANLWLNHPKLSKVTRSI